MNRAKLASGGSGQRNLGLKKTDLQPQPQQSKPNGANKRLNFNSVSLTSAPEKSRPSPFMVPNLVKAGVSSVPVHVTGSSTQSNSNSSADETIISSDPERSMVLMPPPSGPLGQSHGRGQPGCTSTPLPSPIGPPANTNGTPLYQMDTDTNFQPQMKPKVHNGSAGVDTQRNININGHKARTPNGRGISPMRNVGGGDGGLSQSHSHSSSSFNSNGSDQDNVNATVSSSTGDFHSQDSSSSSDVDPVFDRAEELVLSLQVLARTRNLEFEVKRLAGENTDPSRPKFECYPFHKEMFSNATTNNSPAFFAVTRLLFELLDFDGCNERFRTCWPAHEKKQESEYRRTSFQWLTEIYETHPDFFIHGKPSFSVFMSPSGEKCLKLLENFVQFTMYAVAHRQQGNDQLTRQPILHKFVLAEDPKLFQTQLNVLDTRWQVLLKSAVETQKSTMIMVLHRDEKRAKHETHQKEYKEWVRKELDVLLDVALDRPDLFPADAPNIIAYRQEYFAALVKKLPPISLLPDFEDPLASVINQVWKEKLTQSKQVLENAREFVERHKRLWEILDAYETNYDVVLDANKLKLRCLTEDDNDNPESKNNPTELSEIFSKMTKFLNEFRGRIEQVNDLSPEILTQLTTQEERINYLKQRAEKMRAKKRQDIKGEIARTKFKIKAMSLKFDGIDWSRLSKAKQFFSESDKFTWTPPKEIDFNRHTGLTPNFERLRNFLDDSFLGAADEESTDGVATKIDPKPIHESNYSERSTLENTTDNQAEHGTVIQVHVDSISTPSSVADSSFNETVISHSHNITVKQAHAVRSSPVVSNLQNTPTPAHPHVMFATTPTPASVIGRKSKSISNLSMDRVLDTYRRLSHSPNSPINTSVSERRKSSLMGRYLPKDPGPSGNPSADLSLSEMMGNLNLNLSNLSLSLADDIDEMVCNGIMDESMGDFDFEDGLSFNFGNMELSSDNLVKNEPVQDFSAPTPVFVPVPVPGQINDNYERERVKNETPSTSTETETS